jgi:hypothetical protein
LSRVTSLVSFIKKDLNQYNMRDVNAAQILYSLNKAQEDIVTLEDVVEYDQTLHVVTGQVAYPLGVTLGTPPVLLPITKRIISITFPDHWNYPMQYLTKMEFGDVITLEGYLIFPKYLTVRNNALEFWGAPSADLNGGVITLHEYLKKQTQDMSISYEPEIDSSFDEAMRMYAVWYNLPLDHPQKDNQYTRYTAERKIKAAAGSDRISKPRSAIPNW